MTKVKVLGAPMSIATTKDAWYKVAYYLKRLPPWAKERKHLAAIYERPAMARAVAAFALAASETAGIDRWQRREILSRVLRKGPGAYGGKVREKAPKLSDAEFSAKLQAVASTVGTITRETPIERVMAILATAGAGGGGQT